MMTQTRKTDLSPVEAILVERALGEEARRNAHSGTMARIQQLTSERQKLYAESAMHPLLGPSNAARINRKFSCVAYVPAKPSRVAPSGT